MDFGEKKIIRTFAEKIKARSAKIRAGFREAKSETRREKRAKSVFRAFEESQILKEPKKAISYRKKYELLRQKIFLRNCEKLHENANKTLLHPKKAFFFEKKFLELRKSPYFLGSNLCLLKKAFLFIENR